MNVYNSFILNCQKLEAAKLSFSRSMDKLWYINTLEYYLVIFFFFEEVSSHIETWRT